MHCCSFAGQLLANFVLGWIASPWRDMTFRCRGWSFDASSIWALCKNNSASSTAQPCPRSCEKFPHSWYLSRSLLSCIVTIHPFMILNTAIRSPCNLLCSKEYNSSFSKLSTSTKACYPWNLKPSIFLLRFGFQNWLQSSDVAEPVLYKGSQAFVLFAST